MPDNGQTEKYIKCNHCSGTGKCNCDGCVAVFNDENKTKLSKSKVVGCSYCKGVGQRDVWTEHTSQFNKYVEKYPPITHYHSQLTEETERIKDYRRVSFAFTGLFAGIAIILCGLLVDFGKHSSALFPIATAIIGYCFSLISGKEIKNIFDQRSKDQVTQNKP